MSDKRINAGYVITDSIHIGGAEFVIGERATAPSPYVTWECKDGDNYFLGHYTSTRVSAIRDLLDRADAELRYLTQQQELAQQQADDMERDIEREYEKAMYDEAAKEIEIADGGIYSRFDDGMGFGLPYPQSKEADEAEYQAYQKKTQEDEVEEDFEIDI